MIAGPCPRFLLEGGQPAVLHHTYRAPAGGRRGTVPEALAPGQQKIVPNAIDYLRKQGHLHSPLRQPHRDATSGGFGLRGRRHGAYHHAGGRRSGRPGLSGNRRRRRIYRSGLSVRPASGPLQRGLSKHADFAIGKHHLENHRGFGRSRCSVPRHAGRDPGAARIPSILGPAGHGCIAQGYAKVERVSGRAPFYAYGVINDGGAPGQRSEDGAYLPARR